MSKCLGVPCLKSSSSLLLSLSESAETHHRGEDVCEIPGATSAGLKHNSLSSPSVRRLFLPGCWNALAAAQNSCNIGIKLFRLSWMIRVLTQTWSNSFGRIIVKCQLNIYVFRTDPKPGPGQKTVTVALFTAFQSPQALHQSLKKQQNVIKTDIKKSPACCPVPHCASDTTSEHLASAWSLATTSRTDHYYFTSSHCYFITPSYRQTACHLFMAAGASVSRIQTLCCSNLDCSRAKKKKKPSPNKSRSPGCPQS